MAIREGRIDPGRYGLTVGAPALESVGPITFGPDNVLFVADNAASRIYALAVDEAPLRAGVNPPAVDHLDARLAAVLGCAREDVHIQDMAVAPEGSHVYLSVRRGSGTAARPILIRISPAGDIDEVRLDSIPFAWVAIEDAPGVDDARADVRVVPPGEPADEERDIRGIHLRLSHQPLRTATVTDLVYKDGTLLVAGASNEEFSSTLRRIPFPFGRPGSSTSLEIFHVSHGKYETASPIRTFAPYGDMGILASYTCTPLVRFSLADLQAGTQAKGHTVAELGSMNTPLDMVAFNQGGDEYVLVSNSRHPLLKFAAADIDVQEALVTPTEPVGAPRQALPHEGVTRMASWNGSHILMLQRDANGSPALKAYSTESL